MYDSLKNQKIKSLNIIKDFTELINVSGIHKKGILELSTAQIHNLKVGRDPLTHKKIKCVIDAISALREKLLKIEDNLVETFIDEQNEKLLKLKK